MSALLTAVGNGDRAAFDQLFPLVYDELQALAHRQRQHWHGHRTIDTVALVNEAYLKLAGQTAITLRSRAHFFAVASRAMRYILLDYAKLRQAQKRGGDVTKVSFDDVHRLFEHGVSLSDERADALLILDEALQRLAQLDARQSRVVEYRFFGEMTIRETAAALGISTATVKRDWEMARAWLYTEMKDELDL